MSSYKTHDNSRVGVYTLGSHEQVIYLPNAFRWRSLRTADSEIARFHFEPYHSKKKKKSCDLAFGCFKSCDSEILSDSNTSGCGVQPCFGGILTNDNRLSGSPCRGSQCMS